MRPFLIFPYFILYNPIFQYTSHDILLSCRDVSFNKKVAPMGDWSERVFDYVGQKLHIAAAYIRNGFVSDDFLVERLS